VATLLEARCECSYETLEDVAGWGEPDNDEGEDNFCKYVPQDGILVIPEGVKKIGKNAFRNCEGGGFSDNKIRRLVLNPLCLTEIGDSAFEGNYFLAGAGDQKIVIPDSVTKIGEKAFKRVNAGGRVDAKDYGIEAPDTLPTETLEIVIGNGVTEIKYETFEFCNTMCGSITIGNSVTKIKKKAFKHTNVKAGYVVPDSVTKIEGGGGNGAFESVKGGRWGYYSAGTTNLRRMLAENAGEAKFLSCDRLIDAPNPLITDPRYSWQPQTNPAIDRDKQDIPTGPLILGNGLKSIGEEAFYKSSFTGVVALPKSLTELEESAFEKARYLLGFTWEEGIGVERIEKEAFEGVGEYMSWDCCEGNYEEAFDEGESSLQFKECVAAKFHRTRGGGGATGGYGPSEYWTVEQKPFDEDDYCDVPHPSAHTYETPDGDYFGSRLPGYDSNNNKMVESSRGTLMYPLTLPEGLQCIEEKAFKEGAFSGAVVTPATLSTCDKNDPDDVGEAIGEEAFREMKFVTSYTILGEGFTKIKKGTFEDNFEVEWYKFPQSLTFIGKESLRNNYKLLHTNIGQIGALFKIDKNAFEDNYRYRSHIGEAGLDPELPYSARCTYSPDVAICIHKDAFEPDDDDDIDSDGDHDFEGAHKNALEYYDCLEDNKDAGNPPHCEDKLKEKMCTCQGPGMCIWDKDKETDFYGSETETDLDVSDLCDGGWA